jgi:quinol monooxygenase YgiN
VSRTPIAFPLASAGVEHSLEDFLSHVVFVEFWLESSNLDDALPIVHGALADTRAFDGCVQVDVLTENDDPTHLIVVEQWSTPEHRAAYRQWRAGEGALTDLAPFLARPPVTGKYTHNPAI